MAFTDYDKIELQKISYDVISVMSLSLLHHKKRHQTNVTRFFYFGPLPIKISGYSNVKWIVWTVEIKPVSALAESLSKSLNGGFYL